MSFKWSPQQQAAIDVLNRNVLVSASAGAGKTTVLIGRLMKRIEIDRISLNEVIAITFTELAATEMRKRLAQRLNERLAENDDEHLRKQLSLLPSAHITTIHAFCLKLIENYAYVLDDNPERVKHVLDEDQKQQLWDIAFEESFTALIRENPKAMNELAWHFDQLLDRHDNLKDSIQSLVSKLKSLKDPEAYLSRSIEQLKALVHRDLNPELKAYFDLHWIWKIEEFLYSHDRVIKTLETSDEYKALRESSKQAKANQRRWEEFRLNEELTIPYLESLRALGQAFEYEKLVSLVQDLVTVPFINPPAYSNHSEVLRQWERYVKAYKALTTQLYREADWFGDLAMLQSRMESIVALSLRTRDRFEALKKEKGVIDFDDMEHLALTILKDTRFQVAQSFKDQYQEIMVDEFQDTNEVQNELVELLSNGHNVFRVGDVKQSIYRFRNAQPQLMQGLMNLNDASHQVLYLSENYRSKESIVEFNNHLFDHLLNIPELNSSFIAEDKVQIGVKDRQGGGDSVEIHFIQAQEKSENSESEEDDEQVIDPNLETDEDASPKALHIVNTIQEMRLSSPYKNYKDYVVLVRSNAEKALLKEMFEKANIPHHIAAKTGFFNADAIQDIVLMMKALLNPRDDVNFIGLCLSPFIQLTENDCASMALVKGTKSYYDVFNERFETQAKKLKDLFEFSQGKDILTILKAILNHNQYYEHYCDLQNKTNCDYLVQKAAVYRDEDVSLSEFVKLVLRMKESESTEAIPFTEEDDVVRVMTIHQSKGLEFRVVLYWTRLSGKIQDNQSPLLADSDLGFMIKTIQLPKLGTRNNPVRLALEMKTRVDDVLEQMRLMYVALTRAVDKLIIVDNQPKTVIPLQYTTILNALGTTYLIDSAAKAIENSVNLEFKHHLIPPTYVKMPEKAQEAPTFKPLQRIESRIEFKTPSSTHAHPSTLRLNFNVEKGTNHGTQIHALFEALPKQGWSKERILSLDSTLSEKDLHSFMAYYESPLYQAMIQGELYKEYPFHSLMEGVVWHGYIDCFAVCDDKVILVDYKTDHVSDPHQLNELYRDQLLGYAKVLSRLYPTKPIETYAYSVEHEVFVGII